MFLSLIHIFGMGKRTNTILQSAFFTLAKIMPEEDAIAYMKAAAKKSYLKKGQDVVDCNYRAIDAGATAFRKVEVPADWATASDVCDDAALTGKPALVQQVKDIMFPVGKMDGDSLPVSKFMNYVDGQDVYKRQEIFSMTEDGVAKASAGPVPAEFCASCQLAMDECPVSAIERED